MNQEELQKFINYIRTLLGVDIYWTNTELIERYNNFCDSSLQDKTPKVITNEKAKEYFNGDHCNYAKGNCASPSMTACKTCHCYKL